MSRRKPVLRRHRLMRPLTRVERGIELMIDACPKGSDVVREASSELLRLAWQRANGFFDQLSPMEAEAWVSDRLGRHYLELLEASGQSELPLTPKRGI